MPILSESAKPEGGYHRVEQRGGYLADLIRANSSIEEGREVGDDREEAEMEGDEVEYCGASSSWYKG